LANIDLHYVLDEWFEQTVKPLMRGKCRLIRYADDFVIIFEKKYTVAGMGGSLRPCADALRCRACGVQLLEFSTGLSI